MLPERRGYPPAAHREHAAALPAMGWYEKRHRRRARGIRRRSHGPGSPPTFVFAMMLGTVFLAVQWRARLLPHALRVPRAPGASARQTAGGKVHNRLLKTAQARAVKPRQRLSYAQALGFHKRPAADAPVDAASLTSSLGLPPTRYNPGFSSRSSPPLGGPPQPLAPAPRANLTGAAAGCQTYVCVLWADVPARLPLAPVARADLPWVHGASDTLASLGGTPAEHSIFAARRKGPWMGCARRDALLCTGLYRSLKRTGAASLFDLDCGMHLEWLPRILEKLLREYRLVRVTCAVRGPNDAVRARAALAGARVDVVVFQPMTAPAAEFPKSDVVFTRESLRRANLIGAMALLRKVKDSNAYAYVVHENFPRAPANIPRKEGLLINAALPPFSLPPPFYSHVNDDDAPGVEVACRAVPDMFAQRATPTMNELVDPRRRVILE